VDPKINYIVEHDYSILSSLRKRLSKKSEISKLSTHEIVVPISALLPHPEIGEQGNGG